MTTDITLVVGGFPQLAEALRASGRIAKVHAPKSTAELRDIITGGALKHAHKNNTVFIFADTLTVNTPQNLNHLLGGLLGQDYPVIIAAASPEARDLVDANPGAGLIEGPFTANTALGAISGLGIGIAEPDPAGYEPLDIHAGAGEPASKPNDPATGNDPATSSSRSSSGGGWNATPKTPTPNTPKTPTPNTPKQTPTPEPTPPSATEPEPTPPSATEPEPEPTPPSATEPEPEPTPPSAPGWAVPTQTDPPQTDPPTTGGWNKPDPDTATAEPLPDTQPGGQAATPPTTVQAPKKIAFPAPTGGAVPFPGGSAPPGQPPSINPAVGAEPGQAPQRRQGWVVAVSSPKGGTGKSGLTLNLAAYCGLRLQAENKRVCIIDTNFQQPDVGKLLGQYSPTIADIVRDKSSIHPDRINNYLVHRREINVSGLLGPARVDEADPTFINARLYVRILEVLRDLYDIIFLDTPVAELYHDIFRGFVLPQADYLIVPVAPAMHTLMDADNWLHAITQPKHAGGDNVNADRIGVILNQAQDDVGCSEEEVQRELASWLYIGSIPYTKEWIKAGNHREIVATKNYHELNEAFSRILWWATGEEAFRNDPNNQPRTDTGTAGGGLGRFRRLLKRR